MNVNQLKAIFILLAFIFISTVNAGNDKQIVGFWQDPQHPKNIFNVYLYYDKSKELSIRFELRDGAWGNLAIITKTGKGLEIIDKDNINGEYWVLDEEGNLFLHSKKHNNVEKFKTKKVDLSVVTALYKQHKRFFWEGWFD